MWLTSGWKENNAVIMAFCVEGVSSLGLTHGLFECCLTSTETVGLLGTGAQDGHLDFHTAPELCNSWTYI